MQQRFHVSYHTTFEQAHAAKVALLEANPEGRYQVRRNATRFNLVERLPSNQAKFINEVRNGPVRSKKRRRHRVPVL